MTDKNDDLLEAVEGRCPRCGAAREPRQEYCVECGLRLPALQGAVPALRRRWVRRLGWYPGDWIWVSLLTLLVGVAGAALAIAFGSSSTSPAGTTEVVSPPPVAPTTTAALQTVPATTVATPPTTQQSTTTTKSQTSTPGHTGWPAQNGWTLVLFSYPLDDGITAPQASAVRAAADGLPQVGVLDSSDYASLHPGYYVVFSGIYGTSDEASAALSTARAAGFADAYVRQIAR